MKLLNLSLCAFALYAGDFNPVLAQKKTDEVQVNSWAASPVKIDASLSEWGDSLQNYNLATKLAYQISNDRKNLYIAIKSYDSSDRSRILAGGISFSVNPEGKKKAVQTITFPIIDRAAVRKQPKASQSTGKDDLRKQQREVLENVKAIRVSGFNEIIDGNISVNNTYGIRMASSVNENDQLICELAVPLNLLGLNAGSDNVLAYSFQINGLTAPQIQRSNSNQGPYGSGGGRPYGSPDLGKLFTSTQFWVRYILSKNN